MKEREKEKKAEKKKGQQLKSHREKEKEVQCRFLWAGSLVLILSDLLVLGAVKYPPCVSCFHTLCKSVSITRLARQIEPGMVPDKARLLSKPPHNLLLIKKMETIHPVSRCSNNFPIIQEISDCISVSWKM